MALSGTISKKFQEYYTLRTAWSAVQNVAGNYSTVTCRHYIDCEYDLNLGSRNNSCVVGGVTKSFTSSAIDVPYSGGTVHLGTTTHKINHNSDGKKKATLSTTFPFRATIYTYQENVVASGTITLNTIPRASSITCTSFNVGDTAQVNIQSASSSFTHTISYTIGSLTGTLYDKTSWTSFGWLTSSIKNNIYAQMTNVTTKEGTLTCQTYSGNTLIGTKTCTFNCYAKESECKPTVSGTILDTNNSTVTLTGDSSKVVKYLSKPKITVNATFNYSSTAKANNPYLITTGDGQQSYSQEYTLLNGLSSYYYSVGATDSRNYYTALTYNLSTLNKWVEYIKLAFSQIKLKRTESTSSTASLTISGNYFNGSFGAVTNTLTLKYRYKETEGSYGNYINVTPTITNNTFSYTATLSNLDYKKEYTFEIVAEDEAMLVSSGEYKLEKGEAILRLGDGYAKVGGSLLDEYSTSFSNGISKYKTGGIDIDPNNTLEELVLTETNVPTSGFWYVRTMFYGGKTATSNRTQIAYPYAYNTNVRGNSYIRTYVSSIGWSEWAQNGTRMESGFVNITPSGANVPTTARVYFKNAYVKVPNVTVSASSGVVGTQVLGTAVNAVTTTYADIVLTRTNTISTRVNFTVMEEN